MSITYTFYNKYIWTLKRWWWMVLLSIVFISITFALPSVLRSKLGGLKPKSASWTQPVHYSELLNRSKYKIDILYTPEEQNVNNIMTEFKIALNNSMYEITGFEDEPTLYKYVQKNYRTENSSNRGFGIIFEECDKNNLMYTLRSTETEMWRMDTLFPYIPTPGPDKSEDNTYFSEGFISVQTAINIAYMKHFNINMPEWYIQEFPYPSYWEDTKFELIYTKIFPLCVLISMIPISLWIIYTVVNEKKCGAKGLLRANGVTNWTIYIYWYIFFYSQIFIALTLSCLALSMDKKFRLFPYSDWLLLWIFFLLYGNTSVSLALFIASMFNNTSYAILTFVLIRMSMVPLLAVFSGKTLSVLGFFVIANPTGALSEGVKLAATLESSREGLRFNNMLYITPESGIGPFLYILIMLSIYGWTLPFLTIYLMNIKAGNYEISRPWHYIIPVCLKKWCVGEEDLSVLGMNLPLVSEVEQQPDLVIGMQILNVTKVFGVFKAINALSMDVYRGQITALLGHNGAGKTTLMNMLTGMTLPTSGFIMVNGINIYTKLDIYRKTFSYCAQQTLVLRDLSVQEQIIFFGMVKGLSNFRAKIFCKDIMAKFDLTKNKNTLPHKLTLGMVRKLTLANALISNPSILYLDEPTSGLDLQARRQIWDILLKLRGDRIIIITTHSMEEADVLGDQIAIMAYGELKCYGTPMFLKKHYGTGYSVSISYKNKINIRRTLQILKPYNTFLTTTYDLIMKNVVFNLPIEKVSQLAQIFRDLENAKDISIKGINVVCTSMEEVFIKVLGKEGEVTAVHDKFEGLEYTPVKEDKFLILKQFRALLYKKMLTLKSNIPVMVIMLFIVPSFYIFLCFQIFDSILRQNTAHSPQKLGLEQYDSTEVYIRRSDNNLTKYFIENIQDGGSIPKLTNNSITEVLVQAATKRETYFRTHMILAADFTNNVTIFYSPFAIHAPPIGLNILFKSISGSNIIVTNYPYPFNLESCNLSSPQGLKLGSIWVYFSIVLSLCYTYFCITKTKERSDGIKHLQFMAGLRPITYWSFHFIIDFLFLSLSIAIFMTVVSGFHKENDVFEQTHFLRMFVGSSFLFGIAMIFLCYTTTFFFKNSTVAQIFAMSFSVIFATGPLLMDYLTNKNGLAHYLFHFSPLTPFLELTWQSVVITRYKFMCSICSMQALDEMCKEAEQDLINALNIKTLLIIQILDCILYIFLIILLESHCIKHGFYCLKESKNETAIDSDVGREQKRVEIIKKAIEKMYNKSGVRKGTNPIFETESELNIQPNENISLKEGNKSFTVLNTTISLSQSELSYLSGSPELIDTSMVIAVDDLGKKYTRKTTAVDGISFAATKGECFGVLGINGAGKTTLFEMISGYLLPSKGNVKINKNGEIFTLSKHKREYMTHIGYCAQVNSLTEELTGRELLQFFSLLRGTPYNEVKLVAESWIKNLDLVNFCDKSCGNYSWGNKRKLCVALALIGHPYIVLLDEPTSTIDLVTRQKLLKLLKHIETHDQTILLTTNSMKDCEVVCDRVTVISNGILKCIGDIEYLKEKFTHGYTIYIKIKDSAEDNQLDQVKLDIDASFGINCALKHEYKGFLQYHLTYEIQWSKLFEDMEYIKNNNNVINEYMVSNTSLEEVFLAYSKI